MDFGTDSDWTLSTSNSESDIEPAMWPYGSSTISYTIGIVVLAASCQSWGNRVWTSSPDELDLALREVEIVLTNYSFAMDPSVAEDKVLMDRLPAVFSEKLSQLENMLTDEQRPVAASRLLVQAVKSILKAHSNIMKDRLAKKDTVIHPRDVIRSAVWVTSLLELLLASPVVMTSEEDSILPALHLSAKLCLTKTFNLITQHTKPDLATLADLLPIATAMQSSEFISAILQTVPSRELSVLAQLLVKPPSTQSESAWQVALAQCSHFTSAERYWTGFPVIDCIPGCLAIDWLVSAVLNATFDGEPTADKMQEFCNILHQGNSQFLPATPGVAHMATLQQPSDRTLSPQPQLGMTVSMLESDRVKMLSNAIICRFIWLIPNGIIWSSIWLVFFFSSNVDLNFVVLFFSLSLSYKTC